MFELFKIMGTIGVDNSDANQALSETDQQASETSKSIGERMQEGLNKASKAIGTVGTNMTKWVTGPIVGATAGIFGLLTKTGDYADRLLDLSDITGMSTDSLQEWGYVADIAGVNGEAVASAVTGLVRRLPQLEKEGGKANDAMDKLGLSYDELSKLSPDEQVDALMYALSEMEDPLERNAAGSALFGGAWQDLAPILGMGADEIAKTRDEAHELNAVMSNEGLQDANAFRQEMERLKNEFAGAFREISNKFLPVFREQLLPLIQDQIIPMIMNFADRIGELLEWFNNLDETVQQNILKFVGLLAALGPVLIVVSKVVGVLSIVVGAFAKVAAAIKIAWGVITAGGGVMAGLKAGMLAITSPVGWVVAAIVALIAIGVALWANWDTITEKATELHVRVKTAIQNMVQSVISFFSNLVQNGVQSFNSLRNSVTSTVSNLVSSVVNFFSNLGSSARNIISNMVTSVINFFRNMYNSTRNIANNIRSSITNVFNSLRTAVTTAFSNVVNAVRNGMNRAWTTVTGFASKFFNAGRNIVTSIAEGITGAISTVTDAIGGVVSKVRDFLPFSPAKEGPLKDLDKLNFGGTIAGSIDEGQSEVEKAMAKLLDNHAININADGSISTSGYSGINRQGNSSTQTQGVDNTVSQQLNNILNKLDKLIAKDTDMAINMNGRQVARAIIDDVDNLLGLKARDAKRGKGRRI